MSSTELTIDERELNFALYEWLHLGDLKRFNRYQDFDKETTEMMLKEGITFSKEVIAPSNAPADREGAKLVNGRAIVPECLHAPYQKAYELGWAALKSNPEYGGQGAPITLTMAINEAMIGGNLSLTMYFALTEGSAHLIESYGTEFLKKTYIARMLAGEFVGTMCLSEPHAGSDVGACTTSAEPTGDGRYKIRGTKCWISSGDSNLGKNVIHAVLARVKGAANGTKGLSLFVVPMFTVNADGSIGANNHVTVPSIEHKMGINASVTAVLNFGEEGDCYGHLLGEENFGMAYMFQMMNEARMGTATLALGVCSASYQNALAYSKERIQGSHINEMKNPDAPKVALVEHPGVKMYLSSMKANTEAIRALLYGTGYLGDVALASEDPQERQDADDLIQLLTPMCKGWGTEVAIDTVRIALQVLGGVGYTKDFPIEQHYRDLRVSAIYEGTTGIQALDLVGRKMTQRGGELFMKLLGRFNDLAESQKKHPRLGADIKGWTISCEKMIEMAMSLQSITKERGMEGAGLYATELLLFSSAVTAGYFLLQQGLVAVEKLEALVSEHKVAPEQLAGWTKENSEAQFYDNKLKTIHFYVNVILPRYEALAEGVKRRDFTPLEIVF